VKIDKGWIIQYGLVVANMPSRRGGGSAFLDVLVGLNKLFRGNCGGVSVDRDGYGRVRTSRMQMVSGRRFCNGRDVMSPCRSLCAASVEPCLPKASASGPVPKGVLKG